MSKLIVFAGLPGTGKSTLARLLAARLNAVLLNKDDVRAALFAPGDVMYSDEQNDLCMSIIYQLSQFHLKHRSDRPVIIDGRTFSKRTQMDVLLQHVVILQCELKIIECRCAESTALSRLQKDAETHPARDRDARLYHRVLNGWQQFEVPRCVIWTDAQPAEVSLHVIEQFVK